ncbi:conjugal transfer protein TrbL family protein [Massiliimalia massiliensis]|uniref:conjugal transfer protein TrbL family protein n=1 Tax=Massiliimalia massiliensis TaxID=1852384 RepID=UPI001E4D4E63|nr:conjugal transfer protein TrbL family protein [Massiliimalia massiliensis]
MFDWLGDIFSGIGDAIGGVFDFLGEQISNVIWNTMLKWMYETIYNAVADFFTLMGNMGADIFDLDWIQATIRLFTLFGWALFVAGVVVAIFDVAIEYQCGRANIKSTAVNILKGFFACSLIGIVPVELYKFCISLQNTFSRDLSAIFAGGRTLDLAGESTSVLVGSFAVSADINFNLFNILALIAFAYCVIKIFFANIKRGGILLIQMAVGALYMFSVPRGYQDGFNQWMKQIAALCLTAFMQTSLLFLGLLTFPGNMLLGLGIMLAANEVPRIAQQFGLDSSVRVNMMSVVHATTTAVNLTRSVARAAGK